MFSYVKTGTDVPVKVDCADSVYVTVKLNNPIPLPETVSAIYNDGSAAEVPVQWDSGIDLEAISSSPVGIYPVSGTAEGLPVICYVSMVGENYIENYSFEDENRSMWQIENIAAGEQTDFQAKATDAYSGETSLGMLTRWNFAWNSRSAACVMAATTSPCRLRAGMWATTPSCTSMSAPRVWQQPKIENIPCHSGSMTGGVYIKAAGGGWGTLDDFLLNPIQ